MDRFAERFPIQFFGHVPEKKKVVSIPVRFVESETTTGEAVSIETNRDLDEWRAVAAVLKIQKVFRGHLVRKNVRTVRSIDAEIDGVARILSDSADLLRSSEKERLRLGEALMRLLLKLDSVRGVREYRRKITRRAVSLQEKIDSIASAGDPCPADAPETDAPDVSSPDGAAETLETEEADVAGEEWMLVESESPTTASEVPEMREGGVREEKERAEEVERGFGEMDLRAVMEWVVEENARLKETVAELSEKNAEQRMMLGALTRRVERLERIADRVPKKSKCKPCPAVQGLGL
ncbi:hypothetical protein QJS04_geneDACA023727 [Acorus gramineus]|uniref:BAG domain-containing protein n=1 Tax=Acorus gramineus TaxID=55184 RepID=A0AAV8ZXW9_ACOGR|nr:hypothetical protein QJS04_geneDACA023727 [Acorus gramineus]